MITWRKGQFRDELAELQLVVDEFYEGQDSVAKRQGLAYLRDVYNKSNPTDIRDIDWRRMNNTGSWETTSIEKVIEYLRRDGVTRNIERIVKQFIDGKVDAPIVLQLEDKSMKLIAGNTRLSLARALGIRPKILILKTDW